MKYTASLIGIGLFAAMALSAAAANPPFADVLQRPALQLAHPAKSVALIAAARAGSRVVAVGERGGVLLSDDNGASWRQANSPVGVTLTAVQFVSESQGWAVGHSGVVLTTHDGGETWTQQLDGDQAARLEAEAAQQDAGNERRIADAERLVSEGPDKPFLDLWFERDGNGFVVGAYGLILHTADGGKNWASWMGRVPNPRGLHLYSIRRSGQSVYIAGELGFFARSTDGGESFEQVETPYRGTYFAALPLDADTVILGGLRGNVFRSDDGGQNFSAATVESEASVSALSLRADGSILLVDQSGQALASRDGGGSFRRLPLQRPRPLNAIVEAADGGLIGVGFDGAQVISGKPSDSKPIASKQTDGKTP